MPSVDTIADHKCSSVQFGTQEQAVSCAASLQEGATEEGQDCQDRAVAAVQSLWRISRATAQHSRVERLAVVRHFAAPLAPSAWPEQAGADGWTGVQARSAEVRRHVATLQLGEGANPSSGDAGAPVVRLSLADVSAALLSLSTLGGDVLFEAEMEALVQVRRTARLTAPAQRRCAQWMRDQGRSWQACTGTTPRHNGTSGRRPVAASSCTNLGTRCFWPCA